MIRKYGEAPYKAAVIHGGPGAGGTMACVARELSKTVGVVEPIQTKHTIDELIEELDAQLKSITKIPFTIIGHAWGAWLALLYAAKHSEEVRQIVIVGCPPLEDQYVPEIIKRRMQKLTKEEQALFYVLLNKIGEGEMENDLSLLKQFEDILEKTDNVDLENVDTDEQDLLPIDEEAYAMLSAEASEMRHNGEMAKCIMRTKRQVHIIHGEADPHPLEGITRPFGKMRIKGMVYKLENCGHTPFKEKLAKKTFYSILYKIMKY